MGLGFGVQGLGFRVWGLESRVWGLGFGVQGLGFRVLGLGVRGNKGAVHAGCIRILFPYCLLPPSINTLHGLGSNASHV